MVLSESQLLLAVRTGVKCACATNQKPGWLGLHASCVRLGLHDSGANLILPCYDPQSKQSLIPDSQCLNPCYRQEAEAAQRERGEPDAAASRGGAAGTTGREDEGASGTGFTPGSEDPACGGARPLAGSSEGGASSASSDDEDDDEDGDSSRGSGSDRCSPQAPAHG